MNSVKQFISKTFIARKKYSKEKVFGIGLSRTGTTSLHYALESLGYKPLHFYPELVYSSHTDIKIRRTNFNALNDYNAFTDFPSQLIFKELHSAFPSAKFIYTSRPIDDWLRSMKWLIEEGSKKWNWGQWEHSLHEAMYSIDGILKYDERLLRSAFLNHDILVREYFKDRNNFLILDLSDGNQANWSKLTDFLELDADRGSYPEVDSR